jgi:hypothetical protein
MYEYELPEAEADADADKKVSDAPLMGTMLVTVNGVDYVPLAVARKERSRSRSLVAALVKLTDQHHRTLTGSRLHDPERISDFRACPCLTCKTTTLLLSEPHTLPCDCAWCRFQADDGEGATVHAPDGASTLDQAIHLLRSIVAAEKLERLPGDHAVNVALLSVDEWLEGNP